MFMFIPLAVIFAISPMISAVISLTLMVIDRKRAALYLFFVCLAIALPALFFIPDVSYDASRIFREMLSYKSFTSFRSLITLYFQTGSDYRTYPIFVYTMYAVSRTGFFTLLPFISVFGTYFLTTLPVIDMWRRERIKWPTLAIGIGAIVSWISYVLTISGMRFYLAAALVCTVLYFDLFNGSNTSGAKIALLVSLYIVAALIHPGVLLIILARVITALAYRIPLPLLGLLGIVAIGALQYVLLSKSGGGGGYVATLINRLVVYGQNGNFSDVRTLAIKLKEILTIFVAFILLALSIRSYITNEKEKFNKANVFIITLCLLTIGLMNSANLIDRISFVIVPIFVVFCARLYIKNQLVYFLFIPVAIILIVAGLNYNQNVSYLVFVDKPLNVLFHPIWDSVRNIIGY